MAKNALDPKRDMDIDSSGLPVDTMIQEAVCDSSFIDSEIVTDDIEGYADNLEPNHQSFRLISASIILAARIIAAAIKEAK